MAIDIEKYLSVTWVSAGRTYPDLDCYGVVQEVQRDLGQEPWPEYAGATKDELPALAQEAIAAHTGSDLSEGAVAMCYEGSMVTHVAVLAMVDSRMCAIECSEAHGVTISPLRRFERRYVRVEYYR